MANWTVEQVVEWLRKEGFGQFIQDFKDQKIDGAGLLALNTESIRRLLSLPERNETQNQQVIEEFKQKLREWKRQYHPSNTDRRADRPSSAIRTTSSTVSADPGPYTKNVTLSTDKIGTNGRFFNNPSFRTRFQQYILNTHNIDCQIRLLESQEIYLTLNGLKPNVKAARETISKLFDSIQTKIYDNEETDQQMINWSQNITSDAILPVLQQIMDHQNVFTLWEKTAMFYGHLKVIYFTEQSFTVSENRINGILNNEITYLENLPMPNEKTMNFLKNIDQFRVNKQHPELAIIYCKYPYKLEAKIGLFGRKNIVKKTKKQLQSIINKHTIKTLYLKITVYQYDYLLDNCLEELKDIEEEYKDDNLKIRIRLKEFSAPQYLTEKIRRKIDELMFHTIICQYQKIGDSIVLTPHQHDQIQQLARSHDCRIEQIDTKTTTEVYPIPQALSPSSNTSNSVIKQSQEFSTKLSMRKISVSNGSIEIYCANQSNSISRDVTIISSSAGAVEEGVEYMNENGYVEGRDGRAFLFYRWSPLIPTDEKTNKKFKRSIEKFISGALQSVSTCCSEAKTIAFITSEWENVTIPQQPLVEYLINEVKQELEIRKIHWRIAFIFPDKQTNLYGEFTQAFIRLQTEQDGFAQFSSSMTTLRITLAAISTVNLTKCQNELNAYLKKNLLADIILNKEVNLKQWDQHTINAFYKYCLSHSVLPTIDLTANCQLRLIGLIIDVEKSVEKYRFMTEILKQRSNLRIPPPVAPRTLIREEKKRSDPIDPNGYNIFFSFSQFDQLICNRISTRLTAEGYSVCQTPSNTSLSQSLIDKSDLVLIAFSDDYSKNSHSMNELNYAKSTKKKLIPFVKRKLTDENAWLSSLAIADLFYELFDTEIEIEFKGDFDLEYDRLLSTLLHHTKPGVIGRTYPQPTVLPEINPYDADYEEAAFGIQSLALQKVTKEQRLERERAYKQKVAKKIEEEKIPDKDIDELVGSLMIVSDYLEAIIRGENPDADLSTEENEYYSSPVKEQTIGDDSKATARELLDCVKRWLDRSPNVIRGHIPPFTPTGDINDAIFIIHRPADYERDYEPFEHSPPAKYFSNLTYSGSNLSNEQSHEYFQKLVESTKPISNMYTIIEENDTAWDTVSLRQATNEEGEDAVDNEWKTPEEISKLEELDNPNRIWKSSPETKKFIEQKIRNILELKQLCEKSP